jgi:phosphate transport system substrate-binding protein
VYPPACRPFVLKEVPVKRSLSVGVLGLVLLAVGGLALSGCGVPSTGGQKPKDGPGTSPGGAAAVTRLDGGGSTFIGPMMQEWRKLYAKEKGVQVDYGLGGSGKGIQSMTAKNYDFGCTDAPMTVEQLKEARDNGGEVVHIPLLLGAIVPAYNLSEAKQPVKFTGAVLADIYLGNITRWNDPALKKLNPGVDLPDRKIVVLRRAEPSGSTFLWTSFLAKTSPKWKEQVGSGMEVKWPAASGDGLKGTAGVTGQIASTPGALGYIELLYALKEKEKLSFGSIRNQKGKDVLASTDSVIAASEASQKDIPDNLCWLLIDADGEKSYPICGPTWAVLYVKQPPGKGQALVDFLRWVVQDGQKEVTKLDYAPLPAGLVTLIDKKLETVQK